MVFFGPSGFSPVELHLVVPNKVFWVASIVAVSLSILRAFTDLTADFARRLPHFIIALYTVGAYAFAYVCIDMAYDLETSAKHDSVVMMMRWALLYAAVFLIMGPALLILPQKEDTQVRLFSWAVGTIPRFLFI